MFIDFFTLNKFINKTENLLLSEVYENRKKFKSLWKRTHQFRDFLVLLAKDLCKQKIDFSIFSNDKNQFLSLYKDCINSHEEEKLEKCKNKINDLENEIDKDNFDKKKQELSLLYGKKQEIESDFVSLGYEILSRIQFNAKTVHNLEKEFLKDGLFVLVKDSHLSSGIKNFELINRNNQQEIMTFKFFSHKEEAINNEIKKSITFFVYYIENEKDTNNIVLEKLIQKINYLSIAEPTKK